MYSDGLAFAVRVRRQINHVRRTCQLLQPGNNFLFPRDNDVFCIEIILDIDTKSALGRSFTWPSDASTVYPVPRYFWIVFALAGDSTITKPLANVSSMDDFV